MKAVFVAPVTERDVSITMTASQAKLLYRLSLRNIAIPDAIEKMDRSIPRTEIFSLLRELQEALDPSNLT